MSIGNNHAPEASFPNKDCTFYNESVYLRCAVHPERGCEGCPSYTPRSIDPYVPVPLDVKRVEVPECPFDQHPQSLVDPWDRPTRIYTCESPVFVGSSFSSPSTPNGRSGEIPDTGEQWEHAEAIANAHQEISEVIAGAYGIPVAMLFSSPLTQDDARSIAENLVKAVNKPPSVGTFRWKSPIDPPVLSSPPCEMVSRSKRQKRRNRHRNASSQYLPIDPAPYRGQENSFHFMSTDEADRLRENVQSFQGAAIAYAQQLTPFFTRLGEVLRSVADRFRSFSESLPEDDLDP